MAGMMLRWTGGQAGDILMHVISQNKKVYLNFNPIEVSQSGQLIGEPIRDPRYPVLTNLPLVVFAPGQKKTPIDYNQLRNDILQIKKDYEHFVIRCEVHDKTFDQNVKDIIDVFDIGCNTNFLPFVIEAVIKKLNHHKHIYDDKTLGKISYKMTALQKHQFSIYYRAVGLIQKLQNKDYNFIFNTNDIFGNTELVQSKLKEFNLDFDNNGYKHWKDINQQFLPSQIYQTYIKNQTYLYKNNQLSLVEKYVLLALSKEKFQFLA
jgi:hypothetical protein